MNSTPRQILATLFLICGLGLGYSVASSLFKSHAQEPPPPPVENLPPENLPPIEGVPGTPELDANGMPLETAPAPTPLEPALRVVNPEGFIYNPEGLRDPFFPVRKGGPKMVETTSDEVKAGADVEYDPLEPLQAEKLLDYRLVGVMWDVKDPRALIQTPAGRVIAVRKKYRLGREGAVIVAIRESEIVVAEPNPDGTYSNASTRVISMKK